MILWISNNGEDYGDAIYYALHKKYPDETVTWPDKPNYYEDKSNFLNCHYNLNRNSVTKEDIISANRNNNLKAVFILSSGYRVWPYWEELRQELYKDGKNFPVIIIDQADGDRIQYDPSDWDLYFAREFNMGPLRHEESHYPEFQRVAKLLGEYPKNVFPLPFSIIPEKFCPILRSNGDGTTYPYMEYKRDVFFRGAYGKQRAKYLDGVHIDNSLIDIHTHTPIHQQNRIEFFNLIQSSKINLNITAGGNDCMRFWELLGCGGFVLTEEHNQVIEPKLGIDTFNTREEMLDKINFYLLHEILREEIRLATYRFAMENHTCYNRLDYILRETKKLGWEIA